MTTRWSGMIELEDTTASAIAAAFVQARERAGSPAMGMVMTLIIVVPDDDADAAMAVAQQASHEHPARVLGVILGDGRGTGSVHARVGTGDGWGGETALIRLRGEVVKYAESVVLPLLLPDSPVVGLVADGSPGAPVRRPPRRAGQAPHHRRIRGQPGKTTKMVEPARPTHRVTPTSAGPDSRPGAPCWPQRSTSTR